MSFIPTFLRSGARRGALAVGGLLLALAVTLAGCGTAASTTRLPPAQQAVTLALDWTPNTNHTGIYVAMQKGYYAQQGINLKLTPYSSSVYPEQLVAQGQADFAISFPEAVTQFRAQGLPLVSVASVISSNTSALISLKGRGLDSVASLAGRRYAGFGTSYEQPVISQVLSCGGASSPSFQNITTTLDPVEALKSGQFDFAWVYQGWEVIQAQREGLQLNIFPLIDYCVPNYSSPVIVTSQQTIQQKPDMIKRFLAATAQGYQYAIAHPKDAADLLIKGAPAGTFDDTGLVQASQAYLSPLYAAGSACWGQQTLAKWTNYPRFMYDHGAITDANGNPIKTPPDYAAAFTNDYLPACK